MKVLPFPPAPQSVVRIPLDLIREDVVQLRTEYAEEPLGELSNSVETEGLLQPIIVAPTKDGAYELVIGSRRLKAEKKRGSVDILAIVIGEKSPLNYILMALAENIHREPLDPFEEARGFLRLMKEYDLSAPEIAAKIRKSPQYITRRLQLVSLPEEVQTAIAEKQLGVEFAGTLAALPTGEDQITYAKRAIADDLSAEELRTVIRKESSQIKTRQQNAPSASAGKVHARVSMFSEWLSSLPAKVLAKRMNSDERASLLRALEGLEVELQTLRGVIEGVRPAKSTPQSSTKGIPRNAGEEWPSGDLKRITAEDRPSDEELARDLGRTVGAIRHMRSKVMSTKTSRRRAG